MPEFYDTPYNLSETIADKADSLSKAKDSKIDNLSAIESMEFEPATLVSLNDLDSPRFADVTGGLGATEKDGTVHDRTGQPSADRIDGIDSYEVFPSDERTLDYLTNDPRGIRKMNLQRERLAQARGVDTDSITNEDIFEEGAKGTLKALALYDAHASGDPEYIEQVRNWEPEPEVTARWRNSPLQLGSPENPLNIEVERAALNRYGWYGRPMSQVRGKGSDKLIGEEVGYSYDELRGPTPTLEEMKERAERFEAENMDTFARLGNGGKALVRTFAKEVGVDLADWVGESINKLSGGKVGWDVGTEAEKETFVNNLVGFNKYAAEDDYAQAEQHAKNIADGLFEDGKEVDPHDVYSLIKIGFTTPELAGDSFGFLASMFVPLLGWGGKAAKAEKTIKGIKALEKAGKLSKEAAKTATLAAKADVHVLNKMQTFVQKNAGLLQMSAGNVNDQIDAYREEHGEGPSVYKVGQMYATESLLLGLDRWADISILKSPAALKGVREAFSILPAQSKAKVLTKTIGVAAGLTANMGKEAAQEYVQEIGQEFNVQFNFDDNGDFESAVNEAGEILLSKEMQTTGILGAGLGAGGALQFSAAGAAGKVLPATSSIATKVKEKTSKSKKKDPKEEIADTQVVEEEISEDERVAVAANAEKAAEATAKKYAGLFGDEEISKVFSAKSDEEVEAIDAEVLRKNLRSGSTSYQEMYDEIDRAQAVIANRSGTETANENDEVATRILSKAKKELLVNLMGDENNPTLGSGVTPMDVVEDFIEAVEVKDGKLDLTEEESRILEEYVKVNEVPAFRFKNLKNAKVKGKDAFAVYDESLARGERSASMHRQRLRTLLNTPNPSRKAIAKVVDDIDRFLHSQEVRKNAYDSVLNQVKADVANYNKLSEKGKFAVKPPTRTRVPGYDGYIVVSEGRGGALKVNESSQAISDSVADTIDYLRRTKARYETKVSELLGGKPPSSESGISIRPNPKHQEARNRDKKFYDRMGVNKAIIDTEASNVWSEFGDYYKDNKSVINTGEYKEDDVIILNSKSNKIKKGSVVADELAKAYKANATVILDRDTYENNPNIFRTMANYHFKPVKDVDNVTKFMPTKKAEPFRKAMAEKRTKDRARENAQRNVVDAIADQKALGMPMKQALAEKKITAEEFNAYQEAITAAEEYFPGGVADMEKFHDRLHSEKEAEFFAELEKTAIEYGIESLELSEAMTDVAKASQKNSLNNSAAIAAITRMNTRIDELIHGEELISEWKNVQKLAKAGKEDMDAWIAKKEDEGEFVAKGVMQRMIDTAVGVGKKPMYTYYNKAKKDFAPPTTDLYKLKKAITDEDGNITTPYQVIEQDPSKYVEVGRTTFMNSIEADKMRVAGTKGVAFNHLVERSADLFKRTIAEPNLDHKGQNTSILPFANSALSSVMFDKDGNINENAAIAMNVGLHTFIKNGAYLLKKGKKSKADIAEILGKDESQISREALELMSDKGLLYKTAANSIGKEVAGLLGLKAKSNNEVDVQAYDALVADFGQTALLMGVADGILELDNDMSAAEFAKVVLGKNVSAVNDGVTLKGGSGPRVLFIQVAKGKEKVVESIAENTKSFSEQVPGMDTWRKEPEFKKLTKDRKENAVKKIRKEKLGLAVPEGSKETLMEAMDTEWVADMTMVDDILDNREAITKLLGYIETEETNEQYQALSFEEKSVQEAKNRDIERSLDELQWLRDNHKDASEVSMWFEYYFSKNGRFFIESNTINPQTDKQLHRFVVQPKSHKVKYDVTVDKATGSKVFKVNGKDVTFNVHYAVAQAFGLATDKVSSDEITSFAKAVLKHFKPANNKNQAQAVVNIKEAKKKFLETGSYEFVDGRGKSAPTVKLKMEHLGHALQGFDFLEKLYERPKIVGSFSHSISAEFDAVTSGFGLKLLQMPIVDKRKYTWLAKVGIFRDDDPSVKDSMNDVLSSGMLDSYQELGQNVNFPTLENSNEIDVDKSFNDMFAELPDKQKTVAASGYDKKLWEALVNVLPKAIDGKVSSDLRNLFKPAFMTFNYSATIGSIRNNLTSEIIAGLTKKMARADLTDKEDPIVKLMVAFGGDTDKELAALQEMVRTKHASGIVIGTNRNKSLDKYLSTMINASYGAKVEKILTDSFQPFLDAQEKVNGAFKAMFEVFSVEFEAKLEKARKEGPVTQEVEDKIYKDLQNKWPMIKGPLSNIEKDLNDGVGIYALETSSPYGVYSGRKPVRANLSEELSGKLKQESVRVSHMVKQLGAAIAAGSVVPIHYIDGAVMSDAVNNLKEEGTRGITMIHDAIIPPLDRMNEAQRAYNKAVINRNAKYSFINEIATSMERFHKELDTDNKVYEEKDIEVRSGGETMTYKLYEYVNMSYNNMVTLANTVNEQRKNLFEELGQGAKIMHMAGTAEGVYELESDTLEYAEVEKLTPRVYTTGSEITADGETLSSLYSKTQNLCK